MTELLERVALAKEMKACPSHLKEGECDYTPPLELLGIYITYSTVARMVHRGQLEPAAGCYLNATLGCHTFCVVHHCTHESISQHNPEHAAFENTAFRLGTALLYVFDDGYREAHRFHHMRPNASNDPDLILSHSSLPTLGHVVHELSARQCYITLGAPITPNLAGVLRRLGLTSTVMNSWLAKRYMVNWDNVTLKMAVFEAQQIAKEREEYASLRRTLQATWTGATTLSVCLLALNFARWPHRHAPEPSEVESFYDTTFKAKGQVDLWMMGEGPHHLHHAKPDVSYSVLPRVCLELEQRRPDLMAKSRSTADVERLEHSGLAEAKHLDPLNDEPSMQFPWERTKAVRAGKDELALDLPAGVAKITKAVLDSALHVCTTADRELLRSVTRDMGFASTKEDDPDHPMPASSWATSVFADSTVRHLTSAREQILQEVDTVARRVGELVHANGGHIAGDEDLKSRYLDFFVALADATVSQEEQESFARAFAARISPHAVDAQARTRPEIIKRLRCHLESALPSNFMPDRWWYGGSEEKTRRRMAEMFMAPPAPRSRL